MFKGEIAQHNTADNAPENPIEDENKDVKYYDYREVPEEIENQLREMGINEAALERGNLPERVFSPETIELYKKLKDIIMKEYENFSVETIATKDEEAIDEVSGYNDEAEAFRDRDVTEQGLKTDDAVKCFEDEKRILLSKNP